MSAADAAASVAEPAPTLKESLSPLTPPGGPAPPTHCVNLCAFLPRCSHNNQIPARGTTTPLLHPLQQQSKPKLVAVAALLQDPQLSAIVTLKSSGIDRPALLDGKRYASYAARYYNWQQGGQGQGDWVYALLQNVAAAVLRLAQALGVVVYTLGMLCAQQYGNSHTFHTYCISQPPHTLSPPRLLPAAFAAAPPPPLRYESRIVQSMIRADGGKGDFQELVPPMLGIWNTLLDGSSDATWVGGWV